jgi:hypothetical protein
MTFFRLLTGCLLAAVLVFPLVSVGADGTSVCGPAPASVSNNVVSRVRALPRADAVDIEVTVGAKPAVKSERLIMPDRLAFDIDGATTTVVQNRILVDNGGILGVRVSQFRTAPAVVRLVADLEQPHDFKVFPCEGGLIIRIFTSKAAALHRGQAPRIVVPAGLSQPTESRHAPLSRTFPEHNAKVTPTIAPVESHPTRNLVRYANGLLTIQAENVSLASVMAGVGRAMRANVDIPGGFGQEKILFNINSAPPQKAIEALLDGSSFNYILAEDGQPDKKMTIVLTPRSGTPGPSGQQVPNMAPVPAEPPAEVDSGMAVEQQEQVPPPEQAVEEPVVEEPGVPADDSGQDQPVAEQQATGDAGANQVMTEPQHGPPVPQPPVEVEEPKPVDRPPP